MRFFLGVDGGQSSTSAILGRGKLERAVRINLQLACEGAGPEDMHEIPGALLAGATRHGQGIRGVDYILSFGDERETRDLWGIRRWLNIRRQSCSNCHEILFRSGRRPIRHHRHTGPRQTGNLGADESATRL